MFFSAAVILCFFLTGSFIAQKFDKREAFMIGWVLAHVALSVAQNVVFVG